MIRRTHASHDMLGQIDFSSIVVCTYAERRKIRRKDVRGEMLNRL